MCGAQADEADAAAAKQAAEEAAAHMAEMNDDGLGEERRSVVLAEADAAASGTHGDHFGVDTQVKSPPQTGHDPVCCKFCMDGWMEISAQCYLSLCKGKKTACQSGAAAAEG